MNGVSWLRKHKPELLCCKVKQYLKEHGHGVLWTPPYCPNLQPIELFWLPARVMFLGIIIMVKR